MLTECKQCSATFDAVERGDFEAYDEELGAVTRYSLGECPRCSAPLLLAQTSWGDGKWDTPSRLYPRRDDVIGAAVPKSIRNAFQEATRCLAAKASTASAIMVRKTLEGVCHDHGASGSDLADRLRSLKQAGVIEGRLFDWSEELRLVGNEAAHDVSIEVSAQDAADAVAFARAMLEYVYTFRDQFEQFKQRRTKKPASATATAVPAGSASTSPTGASAP